jgi:effector-binding domain-containing protein
MADDLIPIGRFSRMCRLSIKALRRYDDLGLLPPAWVDPGSGYRYYGPEQANRAEAIRILRLVDMPLEEIRDLLSEQDPDRIGQRLVLHRERLEAQFEDHRRRLRFLKRLIDSGGKIMPYDVAVKKVPAQPVVSWTTRTSLVGIGEGIGRGFGVLSGALAGAGVEPAGAPFIVYHEVIDEQTEGNIEICIPVPPGTTGSHDEVVWKEIQGTTVAWTTHHGPYDEISPAYHTITGWISGQGHQIVGPPREIYLNDPMTVPAEDLLTEVQFPIEG